MSVFPITVTYNEGDVPKAVFCHGISAPSSNDKPSTKWTALLISANDGELKEDLVFLPTTTVIEAFRRAKDGILDLTHQQWLQESRENLAKKEHSVRYLEIT